MENAAGRYVIIIIGIISDTSNSSCEKAALDERRQRSYVAAVCSSSSYAPLKSRVCGASTAPDLVSNCGN